MEDLDERHGINVIGLDLCAAAISDDIKVYVKDGWDEHCRHWTLLTGRSSTAKSPAMKEAMTPLQRIDNELRKASSSAISLWETFPKKPTGSGAELQLTQQNIPRPIYRAVILNDASPESIGDIAPDNPRGLFLHADELITLFGGMGRYSGSKGAEQGLYLASFNGIPYTVDRINRGHVFIPNLSIGMLGAITLDGVRKMVQENYETGMLARFIPVMMRPTQLTPGQHRSHGGAPRLSPVSRCAVQFGRTAIGPAGNPSRDEPPP